MQIRIVQRVLGILLMLFSFTQLIPLPVSLLNHDGQAMAFIAGFIVTLLTGIVLWLPVRRTLQDLRLRDGFVIVVMFWVVLSAFGSIPLMLSDNPLLVPP